MRALEATVYAPPAAARPWSPAEVYAPSSLRFYSHGRNALAEALRLAGVAGGSVLIPSFICRDLLAAVAAAGARPCWLPLDAGFRPEAPPGRWPEARAVIAVDFFGWPQDLAAYEEYARRTGAVIVEDAAHALFSRAADARLLGTRAPLGILSLRKSLPLPDGAALLAGPAYGTRLPPPLPHRAPGRRLKAAVRPVFGLAGARAAHAALQGLRALRARPEDPLCEEVLPEPANPCAELARPLSCGGPDEEPSRRRSLWRLCDGIARAAGLSPAFPSLPDGVVPYAYALRCPDPARAAAAFGRHGLRLLPWPDLPAAVRSEAPDHYKDVHLVHFLW